MYLSPMIVHELGYLIPVCDVGDLPGVDKVLPARVRVDGVELGEERLEVFHDDVRVVIRLQEPVRLVSVKLIQ